MCAAAAAAAAVSTSYIAEMRNRPSDTVGQYEDRSKLALR